MTRYKKLRIPQSKISAKKTSEALITRDNYKANCALNANDCLTPTRGFSVKRSIAGKIPLQMKHIDIHQSTIKENDKDLTFFCYFTLAFLSKCICKSLFLTFNSKVERYIRQRFPFKDDWRSNSG